MSNVVFNDVAQRVMNRSASRRIEHSYDACRQIARRSGSSFYPCFMLLPREKQRAMHALYAFMRHSDDLGDNSDPPEQRRRALHAWRGHLEASLAATETPPLPPHDSAAGSTPQPSSTPWPSATDNCTSTLEPSAAAAAILPALVDTLRRFHVPVEHLFDVIEGVEMDLQPCGYETFDDLAEYCRRVASAVGLACIHIWGFDDRRAIAAADSCGLAMQLTNILRDMKEDADAGRIYLPAADLRGCGYSMEELRRGTAGPAFERLLQLEYDRAERLYREGAVLLDYLSPDGRRIFGMMMNVYRRLLEKISRAGPRILSVRVRLSRCEKLLIAARWTFGPARIGRKENKRLQFKDQ